LDCGPLQQISSESKVAGTFFCAGASLSASIPATAPTGSLSSGSATGLSGADKGGIAAGIVVGILVLVGVFVFLFRKKRKHLTQPQREKTAMEQVGPHELNELPAGNVGNNRDQRGEDENLRDSTNQVHELRGDNTYVQQAFEMPSTSATQFVSRVTAW